MSEIKIDLSSYLYQKVLKILDSYDYEDIYTVIFFVYSNEEYSYKNYTNISTFSVSYNTEEYFKEEYADCKEQYKEMGAPIDMRENGRFSEMRWNYAHMEQDETDILNDETYPVLFQWYEQQGIENIGYEDYDCYDENMSYTGNGPVGYPELLDVVARVAKQIQTENYFLNKTGKRIPIIIMDYEFTDCTVEATKRANVHREADDYLEFISNN